MVFFQNISDSRKLQHKFRKNFILKDLGERKQFLNTDLDWTTEMSCHTESIFKKTLLEGVGMLTCTRQLSAMSPGHDLKEGSTQVSRENGRLYRSGVPSLSYLVTKSRPLVFIATSTLRFYSANQTDAHVKGVKRALRSLKGTSYDGLLLRPGKDTQLSAQIDTNLGSEAEERWRSRHGIMIRYGNSVMYAARSPQNCVSLSSKETKYIALSEACKKILCRGKSCLIWTVRRVLQWYTEIITAV